MTGKRRSPTISEAIASYGDTLTARASTTETNTRIVLRQFGTYLVAAGVDISKARADELPGNILESFYLHRLKAYGRARPQRATAQGYVWRLVGFIRFLDQQHWLAEGLRYERMRDDVTALMGPLNYRSTRTDDNVALVVAYAVEQPLPTDARPRLVALRDRAILLCLYGTALRREELASLSRDHLQGQQAIVCGKGSKDRAVFFDRASLEAIGVYIEARGDDLRPLFLRHDDGRGEPGPDGEHWRMDQQTVWHVVQRYATLAGVAGVSPHAFRHFKAQTLLGQGMKLEEVQDILGHASPNTTKRIYARYSTARLRQAFDQYSLPAEELARRVVAGK